MEKIPCIKYDPKNWNYIRENLESFGYTPSYLEANNWTENPYIVINLAGDLGSYSNVSYDGTSDYNRELVTNIEEFLEKAATLKGFTYKRKNIMKINGIEIKPGMVITTEDNIDYIAFPTREGIAFADNSYGGWQSNIPRNIVRINDLTKGGNLSNGLILWEKPKEIVLTMDEIAKRFGYPVEQIKIKK